MRKRADLKAICKILYSYLYCLALGLGSVSEGMISFLGELEGRMSRKWITWITLKFIYSEKATKFWKIFTLLLPVCTVYKSKVKISHNFVAFSEYMNFTWGILSLHLYVKKNSLANNKLVTMHIRECHFEIIGPHSRAVLVLLIEHSVVAL